MYFLNLSLLQFLALAGALTIPTVLLYLLGRSRRKQVVATLRFWVAADQPAVVQRRKKIQQPLSLILQLVSMLLLLLAIAQLRLGTPLATPRDHVLILDTSAWMAAGSGRNSHRTLMDEARDKAGAYVKALPASDRLMLVRADGLATPATSFESDRAKLERAIAQSVPNATALNMEQALAFAQREQMLSPNRTGEIAYIGPGRIAADTGAAAPPKNFRVLAVPDSVENCGLRKIAVRRSGTDPDVWDIYASVRNYGTVPRAVTLSLTFGGGPAGARKLNVPPGSEREVTFACRTRAAGLLEATLSPHDAFPADDHAVLELPAEPELALTVYSNEPEVLRPIVTALPRVRATFRPVAEYRPDKNGSLVILDRFRPPERPMGNAIWIQPPADASPIPVRETLEGVPFDHWCSGSPLCTGLHTKDLRLASTYIFESAPDDIKIGQVANGPVIVARPGQNKIVVFGFQPALSDLRYELATPLLFGNILRWMAPELFRRSSAAASSAGIVTMQLDTDVRPEDVTVQQQDGTPLPFTTRGQTMRFFSGTPGTVRVQSGDRETVYSLTLPELWDAKWGAPAGVRRGLPGFRTATVLSRDLWELLALLGGVGLLAEWLLYGRSEGRMRRLGARLAVLRPGIRKAS